jgi:hypothetical protein
MDTAYRSALSLHNSLTYIILERGPRISVRVSTCVTRALPLLVLCSNGMDGMSMIPVVR